jgi:hypothetical protein
MDSRCTARGVYPIFCFDETGGAQTSLLKGRAEQGISDRSAPSGKHNRRRVVKADTAGSQRCESDDRGTGQRGGYTAWRDSSGSPDADTPAGQYVSRRDVAAPSNLGCPGIGSSGGDCGPEQNGPVFSGEDQLAGCPKSGQRAVRQHLPGGAPRYIALKLSVRTAAPRSTG